MELGTITLLALAGIVVATFLYGAFMHYQHRKSDNLYCAVVLGSSERGVCSARVDCLRTFLRKEKRCDKIIFSGGNTFNIYKREISEALYMKELFVEREKDIKLNNYHLITEEKSRNTHENAEYSVPLIERGENVILITSPSHQRRALKTFKKVSKDKVKSVKAYDCIKGTLIEEEE